MRPTPPSYAVHAVNPAPTHLRLTRLPILHEPTLARFRANAFNPAKPRQFPPGHFADLPAVSKWFRPSPAPHSQHTQPPADRPLELNTTYLAAYGTTIVPLEATLLAPASTTTTTTTTPNSTPNSTTFTRLEQPLQTFLTHLTTFPQSTKTPAPYTLYLAQCPLSNLPSSLATDLPTPAYVTSAGRGDVYDSSIWLGLAPTYTPLHRDPNPNLFVQLAGKKRVRLFEPEVGGEVFGGVQRRVGGAGFAGAVAVRGEEMMVGLEREVLEEVVWRDFWLDEGVVEEEDGEAGQGGRRSLGFEAELGAGDAIFIPKGWWHSVKGVGEGIVGSVNWWFR